MDRGGGGGEDMFAERGSEGAEIVGSVVLRWDVHAQEGYLD